jgi:hypothetical protein
MALLAVCVLPLLTAEADIALLGLSVAAAADAWFAGAVSLASGAVAATCPAAVAAAGLARPLAASPTIAVAVVTVVAGVGALTGAATVIGAATGCGGLAAALAAAAVAAASAVAVPLLLPSSALLQLAEEVFAGAAGAAERTWLGSAGGGTPLAAARFAWESAFAALVFAGTLFGAWGPVLLLVGVLGGACPPFTTGRFGAPTCGAAGAVPLPGVAAGFEPGLEADGWEEAWLCEDALPAFFGGGLADPVFVGAGFVGAGFVDAALVGAGFVDAEFVGAEFAGAGLDDAEFAGAGFAGAGLAAGGGFTGEVVVSGVAVASSNDANGWESGSGAGGGGAGDHCDWANDDVELTSDAILDTAWPLKAKRWNCRLQPPGQPAAPKNQRKFNGLGATTTRGNAAVFAPARQVLPTIFAAGAGKPIAPPSSRGRGGAASRRL